MLISAGSSHGNHKAVKMRTVIIQYFVRCESVGILTTMWNALHQTAMFVSMAFNHETKILIIRTFPNSATYFIFCRLQTRKSFELLHQLIATQNGWLYAARDARELRDSWLTSAALPIDFSKSQMAISKHMCSKLLFFFHQALKSTVIVIRTRR